MYCQEICGVGDLAENLVVFSKRLPSGEAARVAFFGLNRTNRKYDDNEEPRRV